MLPVVNLRMLFLATAVESLLIFLKRILDTMHQHKLSLCVTDSTMVPYLSVWACKCMLYYVVLTNKDMIDKVAKCM